MRFLAGVFALAILLPTAFLLSIGRWLVVEDPLSKAQAIVVLSGRIPTRALAAAQLYRQGLAPEIWLTHPVEPTAALAALDIVYEGEDVYNTRVLLHEGIPLRAIRVLPGPIVNTADEIADIVAALPADNSGAVIIMTTKAHTRRTRELWKRIAKDRGRAIIRAAPDDPFDPAHWWRTSGDERIEAPRG